MMQYVNPELRHLNVDILAYDYMHLDKNWHSENARNFYTRLYLVTGGSGYLRTDTEVIEMRPGNIYLIPSEYDFDFGCERLEKVFFHILLPTADKTDVLSGIGRIFTLSGCGTLFRPKRVQPSVLTSMMPSFSPSAKCSPRSIPSARWQAPWIFATETTYPAVLRKGLEKQFLSIGRIFWYKKPEHQLRFFASNNTVF